MSSQSSIIHQSAVALAAHTGTVAETSLLSVTLPALGANDRVSVSLVLSRPASQVAEATVQLKLNANLCQRWRVGTGRGGAIGPEPVIINRNSTSSQLFGVDASSDGLVLTGAVDMSVPTTLALLATLGDAADSLTVEAVVITVTGAGYGADSGQLAALATVKARLGITASTENTLLTNLLELATGIFNRHCNRVFARSESATDEFDADHCELNLSRPPLESVSAFALKTREADGWVTQTDVDYIARKTPGGCILSLTSPLGSFRERLRVTYTGGYVLPGTAVGSGQTALPDEVEHACVEQVAFWYQNRTKLGLSSASDQGVVFVGGIQQPPPLLAHVQAALRAHVRWNP